RKDRSLTTITGSRPSAADGAGAVRGAGSTGVGPVNAGAVGAVVGGAVCMVLLVSVARVSGAVGVRWDGPTPQRAGAAASCGSAASEASELVRERRNSTSATTITSAIATTETSRNQLLKRSRKSGLQATALRSKATRKAKTKEPIASSRAKPMNSGVF